MITAQDIREKTFATVRRDGYDMDVVDAFLDELANETEVAQKENAVLKSKMKILVDKIEEYRANEEAAQRALLSAQKLAIQIEGDARARAARQGHKGRARLRAAPYAGCGGAGGELVGRALRRGGLALL